jgi:hypothetical protein
MAGTLRWVVATVWLAVARKPSVFPELIDPDGEWVIEDWKPTPGMPCPCTDVGGRRMYVPAGKSPFAREVRFHELLHVKHSPKVVPDDTGATIPSILAAEDCRINMLGALIREHDALGATPMQDAFTIVMSHSVRRMAQLTAACLGYASSGEWVAGMNDALETIRSTSAFPMWVRKHARAIQRAIEEVAEYAPGFFQWDGETNPEASFSDTIQLAHWLDSEFPDAPPSPPEEKPGTEDGEYDEAADEDGGRAGQAVWGEMRIDAPALSVRSKGCTGRRTVPSLGGNRIVHANRAATGEIFGRPVKRAIPDAVLIDQSGSMHWESDQLVELVAKMPVGVVAGYAGSDGKGVLRILAKDGRMVPADRVSHEDGGNEIDGPALRWLAKQPGRKVWVSDQGVCSSGGNASDLMADCNAIRHAAGIKVCLSTDPVAILRTLRGK